MRYRAKCRASGLSLIELLISMSIAIVIGLMAVAIFRMLSQASRETTSSYLISRDFEEAVRILREDLRFTNLGAVRVYDGTKNSPPALTCPSAMLPGQAVTLNEDGYPQWQGSVVYRLELSGDKQSASLIRTFLPQKGFLPQVIPAPLTGPPSGESKVLLTDLIPPNATVSTKDGDLSSGSTGGFGAYFLHKNAQGQFFRSTVNPIQTDGGQSPDPNVDQTSSTRLVEVQLWLRTGSDKSNYSSIKVPLQVAVRY